MVAVLSHDFSYTHSPITCQGFPISPLTPFSPSRKLPSSIFFFFSSISLLLRPRSPACHRFARHCRLAFDVLFLPVLALFFLCGFLVPTTSMLAFRSEQRRAPSAPRLASPCRDGRWGWFVDVLLGTARHDRRTKGRPNKSESSRVTSPSVNRVASVDRSS